MKRRRIVANLDCEADFAAMKGRPRAGLTQAALEQASALGTLLRVFVEDGDRLWTPVPIATERLAEVPGLPRPELESGPLERLPTVDSVLAWAETEPVAKLRAGSAGVPQASDNPSRRDAGAPSPVHELIRQLPKTEPTIAARVHHRGFALDVARELGCALPGATMLRSTRELEQHLQSVDADAWILKAPLSAAGRARHIVQDAATATDQRRIERLFAHHRELLFEPWLDRTDDFGVAAAIDGDSFKMIGFHRSFVAARGGFLGVELEASYDGIYGLADRECQRLEDTLDGVARALIRAGYQGPFGIDCWRYRQASGDLAFHPLGEINARMTMGLVARALVDRVRGPLDLDPDTTVRLQWGPGEPPSGTVPLLHPIPGSDRSLAAWLTKDC